jgi:hypothetical protein
MRFVFTMFAVGFLATGHIDGQTMSLGDLVKRLRQGGNVLVMRHASSPREAPSTETANSDNIRLERQLDEAGRRGATAMGDAIRALKIPIGTVLTSPTYRARSKPSSTPASPRRWWSRNSGTVAGACRASTNRR